MTLQFPEVHRLTGGIDIHDYRPAINASGDKVVFERTVKGRPTELYIIDDLASPVPRLFLPASTGPVNQTRPDWCWTSGNIAYNGSSSEKPELEVWIADDGGNTFIVPGIVRAAYPTWIGGDGQLVVMNADTNASPTPRNSIFDQSGTTIQENVNGIICTGRQLYGGMPAACPLSDILIAFAGQPNIRGWNGSAVATYNQNANYIFINEMDENGIFTSRPIEIDATIDQFDPLHQGRAPAWSPDGRTIAFESNRSGNGYAIYLYDFISGNITQVTDPASNAQHARFFPDGDNLILSLNYNGTSIIAWINVHEARRKLTGAT
ncbi:PD40 domain-containing protein [Brucella cytisi]|uniref:Uncharacterized protein n=1 Tax=Brucella cytisi TaxID=407152 RepID=A0A1J6ICL6_9HYPH|nr:PD40 domain-containing protein [Brucella cytisi]OIS92800.1 hypothetical protein BLA27_13990 [Brucella cytisi]